MNDVIADGVLRLTPAQVDDRIYQAQGYHFVIDAPFEDVAGRQSKYPEIVDAFEASGGKVILKCESGLNRILECGAWGWRAEPAHGFVQHLCLAEALIEDLQSGGNDYDVHLNWWHLRGHSALISSSNHGPQYHGRSKELSAAALAGAVLAVLLVGEVRMVVVENTAEDA